VARRPGRRRSGAGESRQHRRPGEEESKATGPIRRTGVRVARSTTWLSVGRVVRSRPRAPPPAFMTPGSLAHWWTPSRHRVARCHGLAVRGTTRNCKHLQQGAW